MANFCAMHHLHVLQYGFGYLELELSLKLKLLKMPFQTIVQIITHIFLLKKHCSIYMETGSVTLVLH